MQQQKSNDFASLSTQHSVASKEALNATGAVHRVFRLVYCTVQPDAQLRAQTHKADFGALLNYQMSSTYENNKVSPRPNRVMKITRRSPKALTLRRAGFFLGLRRAMIPIKTEELMGAAAATTTVYLHFMHAILTER